MLELNAVYGVDPDSFVDFVNVVAEDNIILRLVLVVPRNPLLESFLFFGFDRLSSFVVELLRGQFQQKRLIFFEFIQSIFMLFNLAFHLLYLHVDLFYLLFFLLLLVVSLLFKRFFLMLLPIVQRDELHQRIVVVFEVFFRLLQSASPLLFFGF